MLAALLMISAAIFVPYLVNGKAFILGWDMRTIYSSNFENLRTMVQAFRTGGTLPYWSWVNFLGNDFYSSKLFYFNDFFEYFFVFTDLPYSKAILWMTFLRYLTAAFSFYAYARYQKHSEFTCLISPLLYAFSAYLIQIMRDPFFASFIAFLPLYYLAVDRYIREQKPLFFVFMVFFMFFNSYYLFYMTSLFTILYFIVRWHREYHSFQGMWKAAFILIGYYLAGFACSGVIVIPEVLSVLANSRVGTRSSVLFYESILPYIDYLSGLFTPTTIPAYRTDEISRLYLYDTPNHQLMAVYLWAGSVSAILFPQLFAKPEDRKMNLTVTAVISAFALIPILSSVMHGFSESSFRWMANVTFLLIASIMPYLDQREAINRKLIAVSAIVNALLLTFTPFLFAWLVGVKVSDMMDGYLPMLACVPFILLNGFALFHSRKTLLLAGTVLELCLVGYFSCYGNPTQSALSTEDADRIPKLMGEKNYYNEWTLTLDPDNARSFYRSYIDPEGVYFGIGTNYNLDANIRGLLAYDSTYLASTNDLIALDPEHVIDYLPWTFDVQNPHLMTLLSTKYAIIRPGQRCPFEHGELIGHYADTWEVYLNSDYINLGKTYTGNVISYDAYDPSGSERVLTDLICHEEDREAIAGLIGSEEVQCYSAYAEGNHVSAGLRTTSPGFAVLSVPFDQGWAVSVNGQPVKTYAVNGGLTGIAVTAGENDIQMWFTPRGLTAGKYLTLAGLLVSAVLAIIQLKRSRRTG